MRNLELSFFTKVGGADALESRADAAKVEETRIVDAVKPARAPRAIFGIIVGNDYAYIRRR